MLRNHLILVIDWLQLFLKIILIIFIFILFIHFFLNNFKNQKNSYPSDIRKNHFI